MAAVLKIAIKNYESFLTARGQALGERQDGDFQ